jgi:HEAT repeat protein
MPAQPATREVFSVGISCRWKMYGHEPVGFQRFADALNAGLIGAPRAAQSLANLVIDRNQPPIARATALSQLRGYSPSPSDPPIKPGIYDASALVRYAAVDALSNSDPRVSVAVRAPLLTDSVRAVRIEAARVLARTPVDSLSQGVMEHLKSAVDECVESLELNTDRPESHMISVSSTRS